MVQRWKYATKTKATIAGYKAGQVLSLSKIVYTVSFYGVRIRSHSLFQKQIQSWASGALHRWCNGDRTKVTGFWGCNPRTANFMVAVKGLFKITASYRAAYQKLSSSYDRFHSVVKNVQFQFSPFERTDFGQSAYNIRQPFFVFEIQPTRQSRNPRRRRMCLDEFHRRVKRRIKANRINSLRRNFGGSIWTGPCSSTPMSTLLSDVNRISTFPISSWPNIAAYGSIVPSYMLHT